jgi:midasin (ATPase involved in ribosome maturation)
VIQQIAESLNLPFHAMSVNMQTSKSDLIGFMDANGIYRYNGFITAFKQGGIFLLDEIDAGNANVLTVLNSAISNGFIETPDGVMLQKHGNFRLVATANTFGNGANTKFVGRNKLDFATKNRFVRILMTIDEDLELSLIGGDKNLHKGIKAMRNWTDANLDEFSITQRSSIDLKDLLSVLDIEDALNMTFLEGLDEDSQKDLKKIFFKAYGNTKSESSATMIETKNHSSEEARTCPECNGFMSFVEPLWRCDDMFCSHEEKD